MGCSRCWWCCVSSWRSYCWLLTATINPAPSRYRPPPTPLNTTCTDSSPIRKWSGERALRQHLDAFPRIHSQVIIDETIDRQLPIDRQASIVIPTNPSRAACTGQGTFKAAVSVRPRPHLTRRYEVGTSGSWFRVSQPRLWISQPHHTLGVAGLSTDHRASHWATSTN